MNLHAAKLLGGLFLASLTVNQIHGGVETTEASQDYNPPPPPNYMQMHAAVREEPATGLSIEVFGGAIGFQSGTLHISAAGTPFVNGDTKSEFGGVGGIRIENTWPSFSAIGGGPDSTTTSVFMPAIGFEAFWTGYRYKAVDSSFGTGSDLRADINAVTFQYTPKIKFNLGAFRPYFGFGVGGTYIDAGNEVINVPGVGSIPFTGSSDDFDFSVSGLAGCEFFVDPHWSIGLDYKYLYIVDPTFHGNLNGVPLKYHLNGIGNNIFAAGISYYF